MIARQDPVQRAHQEHECGETERTLAIPSSQLEIPNGQEQPATDDQSKDTDEQDDRRGEEPASDLL